MESRLSKIWSGPMGMPFSGGRGRLVANAIVKRADRTADGKVTLAELLAAAASLFDECDKDKNKTLDEAELAAGLTLLFGP